jgi:hypothetical protein
MFRFIDCRPRPCRSSAGAVSLGMMLPKPATHRLISHYYDFPDQSSCQQLCINSSHRPSLSTAVDSTALSCFNRYMSIILS